MKIKKLHLTNFKRFTNLLIDNLPETSKLILLIGSNGSGKSSVFDAFGYVNSDIRDVVGFKVENDYFKKDIKGDFKIEISFDNGSTINSPSDRLFDFTRNSKLFYGRTSFRQIPRLTRTSLGQNSFNIEEDSDRPKYFIDRDNRFENDIEKITEIILKEFFRGNKSNEEIREKYINPINESLKNIFGEGSGTKLELIEIIPPLEGKIAQINFRKGNSEIHYNYLSAGEKEVFNLLINLLSRTTLYKDTIYFFDEIDLHLNTKLQFNLLKEIVEKWIPENCQLWTATHSLGFIEYAKQSEKASIIDFDDLDFDLPRVLLPEPKDNPDIYEIAVGKEFLPSLFRQMNIYFVENKDRDYYASVGIDDTIFVSDNNRNNVYHKVRSTNYKGIVDRDFLSDDDILKIREQYKNLYILKYYSIENYFYHPDNLQEYYNGKSILFDKTEYVKELLIAKNQVKDSIIPTLSLKRTEYPYFGEPEFNGKPLQNRFKNKQENADESTIVAAYLNSNELEVYYKSLPMKTYCTHLPQRQNIAKSDLAKTLWFKQQIEMALELQANK